MKTVLLLVGVIAALLGLLWVGQGLGYIHWPPTGNFMLNQRPWAVRGAILLVVGIGAIWWSRRR